MNKIVNYLIIGSSISILYLANARVTAQPRAVVEDQIALFPDWSSTSFSTLDPMDQPGEVTPDVDSIVEWEASRVWSAGDAPKDVIKVGDLENTLSPGRYSVEDIYNRLNANSLEQTGIETVETQIDSQLSSIPPDVTLADFSLIESQTIESLVEAVPELGQEIAADVEPVADLLVNNGIDPNATLEELALDAEIKTLSLDSVNLESYAIDSIPGIGQAQIEDFANYEDAYISQIPGLEELPLSDFPNPVGAEVSFIGRIDFIWGNAESNKQKTITGSKVEGFNVPCQTNCAYLELDDIENFGRSTTSEFEGNQWIAGKDNWVKGGTGCLSGGEEPTGLHQFGDAFKSVLWETSEAADTAKIVMFFNINTKCGSSAYNIGPIAFPNGNVSINDKIYLGSGN
jgi:hypothetical protein